MLYDEEFVKGLPELKQFENPWVIGICKINRSKKLRRLIEKWFLALPKDDRPKMLKKLRSQEDRDFIPAFYELVIHQFCLEEGWEVEYEPTLPSGRTPDLRVTVSTGEKFILEVATIFDSDDFAKSNTKKVELTHQISALSTDWILRLHYIELPLESARPEIVTVVVEEWLSSLSNSKGTHKKTINKAGYHISIEALKQPVLKPKNGCILSVMDPGMSVPDYSRRIKRILEEKRSRYSSKDTGLPLIVMICGAGGLVRTDNHALDKALFGQHQAVFESGAGGDTKASFQRDRSGYFTPREDEEKGWVGYHSGLSAVMYTELMGESSFQMQVFHNPLPAVPLDPDIFSKMAQLVVFENKLGIQMRWVIADPENLRVIFS